MTYCKPRGSEPTRHLFIGNTGPAIGTALADIQAQLSEFGDVQQIVAPDQGQARVFASFETSDSAQAAHRAASQISAALGGRALVFKYAALVCRESEQQVSSRCSLVPVLRRLHEQELTAHAATAAAGQPRGPAPCRAHQSSRHRRAGPAAAARLCVQRCRAGALVLRIQAVMTSCELRSTQRFLNHSR